MQSAAAALDTGIGSINFQNGVGSVVSQITARYPGTDQSQSYMRFTTSGLERLRIDNGGKVGIGISVPTAFLHIAPAAGTTGFEQSSNGTFNVDASGVVGGRLTVLENGNVGIGTNAPDAHLTVAGTGHFTQNVTVDGAIYAKYQDVAEWVPAGGTLEAGTVVVLNRAKANEVAPSTKAYDTAVAGVVSDQPGLLLGTPAEGRAKIATTGRVKVRVDATKAPIAIGDLLVTSDVSGTAMRSEPMDINGRKFHQPGTLIGKALEPLPGGEGEILVLLSLQ